jgi:hypothetical protein
MINLNEQSRLALQQGVSFAKRAVQLHGRCVTQIFRFFQFTAQILLLALAGKSFANEPTNHANHPFNIYKKNNAIYANDPLQKFIKNGILDCSLRLERKGNKRLLMTSQGNYEIPDFVDVKFIDDAVAVVRLNFIYENMMSSRFLVPLNELNQPIKGTWNSENGRGFEYQFTLSTSHLKIIQNIKKIYPSINFHKTAPDGTDADLPAFSSDGIGVPRFSLVLSNPPARSVQLSHFCKFNSDSKLEKPTDHISAKLLSAPPRVSDVDKVKLISAIAEFADLGSKELPVEKFERHFNSKGAWTMDQATGLPAIYSGSAPAYGLEAQGSHAVNKTIFRQGLIIQFPRLGYCVLLEDLFPVVPPLKRDWHLGPAIVREDDPSQWELYQTYQVEKSPSYVAYRFVLDMNNRLVPEDQRCLREIITSHYLR